MAEPAGRLLGGRYRMEALLASGGMGAVWAARDLPLDRPVAVKVLGPAFADDGRAAERLRREARAAGRLEHPSIARVLDQGEHEGRPYLVMELLEGESLAERIDRAGPMAPAEAARVVAEVAEALEAAHRAGVVHRDVKPGNVFLASDGAVKVLDFGIASAAGETALTTGDLIGTPAYLAPERVLGHRATPAADVYALGVVLYELLAGRRPFEAASDIELAMAHVHARPTPLALVAPSTPPFLAAVCEQAMSRDPAARPRSAAAFADLLRAPTASPPTRPLPVAATAGPAGGRRPRSRKGGLLVALVLAVAVLAALPALARGLLPSVTDGIEAPFAVVNPNADNPAADSPAADAGDDPAGTRAQPEREAQPASETDPPAGSGSATGDDHDRQDDDSSGSGRSGGGGSSGPG